MRQQIKIIDKGIIRRFWSSVLKNQLGGCWYIQGPEKRKIIIKRYGTFLGYPAHRVSWYLTNGSIPRNLFVLHKCDIPACVNPEHLFLGTHKDNMQDKMKKGRHVIGGGKAKVGVNIADEILLLNKIREKNSLTFEHIGRTLNVSMYTVHRWISGKSKPSPLAKEKILNYVKGGAKPSWKQ